jgi:hypothetical protein
MRTALPQIFKLFLCGTLLVPLLDGITAESNQDLFHKIFSESSKEAQWSFGQSLKLVRRLPSLISPPPPLCNGKRSSPFEKGSEGGIFAVRGGPLAIDTLLKQAENPVL